jgi:hypothetical protein
LRRLAGRGSAGRGSVGRGLCGAGRVVRHPGLAERVGAEQADYPELVRVREAGPVERPQAELDEYQRARRQRGRRHRHLGDPRVPVHHVPLDGGPHPQPGPPAVPFEHEALRAQRARVPHELQQLFLAGDVPVQRHRGEAQLVRHPRHRHRLKALGVGQPDSGRRDRVGGQPGPRAALPALAPPPEQVEPGRQRRWLVTCHIAALLSPLHLHPGHRIGASRAGPLDQTAYVIYKRVYAIHS